MQPPPLRWAVAPLVFSRKARNAFRAYGVLPVLRHFLGRLSRHGLRAAVSPPQVPPPEGNPRGTYQDWIGRYDRWTAADDRRSAGADRRAAARDRQQRREERRPEQD